ncbi:M4 family metallopeptidase [Aquibacillus sp. 3ASR75-11]|uniref:Neutral metalloproteinase n=1 Tax=Terrihalobacillus insolitus TaxID=2950438 RepID=A0A9X3WU03_9BACI|nr:M4 family metallopeptidase [Terrihalobacillus insolitus]MDC3413870.1 M4 family metallopeptidase [Terrihalobacillus insolitus]MDC3424593.1 M4 family metallopeptidase [Terrihalobacillus insolitus]
MKKRLIVPMILSSTLLVGSYSTTVVNAKSLESSPRTQVQKEWNPKANVPLFVKEKQTEKRSTSASDALSYLKENKEKVGIKNPKANFKAKEIIKDNIGSTHVRLAQTEDGVSVEGSEVIVHYNADNEIYLVNGYYNQSLESTNVNTTPTLSSDAAVETATSAVDAPAELLYEPTSELVIYPSKNENYLAYKVNVNFMNDTPGNWFVYIDANTGEVIDKQNTIMDATVEQYKTQNGVGIGVLGDQRQLHVTKTKESNDGAEFALADYSHEDLGGILTYSGENSWAYGLDEAILYTGIDASFKDDYDRAAVDAHYNSEKVFEYFKNEHNRNSLDGKGMAIKSVVHFGENYNNAFWNGRYMTYGDGDGEFMNTLSAGLDVAAHEMTHGVTSNSANLNYRFQSGALNESFSDVFAVLVDDDNWELGEDIMAEGAQESGRPTLRSLSDPSKYSVGSTYAPYGDGEGKYPTNMDEYYDLPYDLDNGGVHINSSIPNHAAYLIGQEIGREKLGDIYYRALTVYLTPTSDFSDARKAIVQSAVDLYGEESEEVKATESGFDQVGIYE